MHLEEQDLPKVGRLKRPEHARPMYPIALVRALALTWLFAGLRSDELVRLRVGRIRWQRGMRGPQPAQRTWLARMRPACLISQRKKPEPPIRSRSTRLSAKPSPP